MIAGYLTGLLVFDSLLVGRCENGKLLFVSKVRNGFTPSSRLRVASHFKGLEIATCPFTNLPESRAPRFGTPLTADVMKEC